MVRRPPRSNRPDTRFPYTTLFRSDLRGCLSDIEYAVELAGGQGVDRVLTGEQPAARQHDALLAAGAIDQHAAVERVDNAYQLGLEAVLARSSEEHTSELQSLMRISYAVFCLKKTTIHNTA